MQSGLFGFGCYFTASFVNHLIVINLFKNEAFFGSARLSNKDINHHSLAQEPDAGGGGVANTRRQGGATCERASTSRFLCLPGNRPRLPFPSPERY